MSSISVFPDPPQVFPPNICIPSQLNCRTYATKLFDGKLSARVSESDVVTMKCMYRKHCMTSMDTKYKKAFS